MCESAPPPPPSPDYAAAAAAQGTANLKAGVQTASLGNPNIVSPYGNQTVTWGATGPDGNMQPTVTQTLTPEAQAALTAQQKTQAALAGLAQQGIGQAQTILGTPFKYNGPGIQTSLAGTPSLDYGPRGAMFGLAGSVNPNQYGSSGSVSAGQYGVAGSVNPNQYGSSGSVNPNQYGSAQRSLDLSGVAQMPVNAGTTGQQAILSRLNPQISQNNQALTQQLANQGITPGSEAYNNAMRVQGQQNNDLYTQAALQGVNLDMSANQQGFGQALSAAGLYNSGLGQDFGQGLAAQDQQNAAVGQNFGRGLSAQDQANSAVGQNFGQGLAAQDQANSAVGQNFGRGAAAQDQTNSAIGQNFGQGAAAAGLYNQAQGQQFNQGLQSAQFGNSAAQQSLAQQLQLYNQPLNMITALMSGSQIQNPQFQGYTGANVAPAPVFQGAQAQDQSNLSLYGIQSANANAANQGLFDLLGTGAKMFSPFKFSDVRLKSNIERVGDHPLGIGVYEYDIFGHRERGVLAQEVERVRPGAVYEHPSGLKMVDYGALDV